MRKPELDASGFLALVAVTALLAMGGVLTKLTSEGLQPVFQAGARSAIAILSLGAWLWWRGLLPRLRLQDLGPGLLIGLTFSTEFLGMFLALDLTTLGRASLLFYSMPVWTGIIAHFFLPGERATGLKALGLALAFAGTAWAVLSRSGAGAGQASWIGDLSALGGALGWTATALATRTRRMAAAGPEAQLFWMVAVSAPVLLALSPLFGPLLRDPQPIHLVWLLVNAVVIATGGYIAWLWLYARYSSASVASFAFLSPLISILLGYVLFDEPLAPGLLGAAALVSLGIVLINRPPRPDP